MADRSIAIWPLTAEEAPEHDAQAALLGMPRARFVATEGDRRAGSALLGASPYLPLAERELGVEVERAFRHRGVGSMLLAAAETAARSEGLGALWASIPDEDRDALRWAGRRGFQPRGSRQRGVLDLARFAEPPRAPPAGVALRRLSALNEDWPRLFALFLRLLADAPDMRGVPGWTPWQAELALRRAPGASADRIHVALRDDGRWIGLSAWSGGRGGDSAYAFFTGVLPDERGRGVATALKVASALAARSAGFATLRLDNHVANGPMRAVNRALGAVETTSIRLLRKVIG